MKFGVSIMEIKTKINADYNTFPLQVLKTPVFTEKTVVLLQDSRTPLEFYERLGQQREARLADLTRSFERFGWRALKHRHAFGVDEGFEKETRALIVFSERSFDALVEFFEACLPADEDNASHSLEPDSNKQEVQPQYRAPDAKILRPEEIPEDARPDDRPNIKWKLPSMRYRPPPGLQNPDNQPNVRTGPSQSPEAHSHHASTEASMPSASPSPERSPVPEPSLAQDPSPSNGPPQSSDRRRTKRDAQRSRRACSTRGTQSHGINSTHSEADRGTLTANKSKTRKTIH